MKAHVVACAIVAIAASPLIADHIEIDVAPQMREYCRILRFPQGWKVPVELGKSSSELGTIFHYGYRDDYEFRVPGLQGTNFLVAGLILPEKRYTTNRYEVDLSDAKAQVRPATESGWVSATPIRLTQKEGFPQLANSGHSHTVDLHGFQLTNSGEDWASSLLSSDNAWIVLQSWTGSSMSNPETHLFVCPFFGCRGHIFLDIFNVDTGKKVLTIVGTYSGGAPENLLMAPGWLTERYFIVPLGEHRERCLVCEFAPKRR